MNAGYQRAIRQVSILTVPGSIWTAAVAAIDWDPMLHLALTMVFVGPVVLAVSYALALRSFWHVETGRSAPLGSRFAAGLSQCLTILSLFAAALLALLVSIVAVHTVVTWPSDV